MGSLFTSKKVIKTNAPLFRYRQGEPTLGVGTSNLFYEKETEDPLVSILGAGTDHGNLKVVEPGFYSLAPNAQYNGLGEVAGDVVVQEPIDNQQFQQQLQALLEPPQH